ncbi:hypothetical protein C7444_11287 [Sphaerotilus hippei]|uniref:CoA-binding domain-containing protein n=2 Tax=Sphaerotilus hippei TaxID=744406 RepID=A0A318GY44_9BURK|nr:hypothetical protein C7444_11287 [Sphaerotilus hippei]
MPRTVAVVGLSDRASRPSHRVATYLREAGWTVVPVHPLLQTWEGLPCWPDLDQVPVPIDVVDVFRRTEDVLPVARAAVRIGARCLWQQQGVVNTEADRLARAAGLLSVMDRCLLVDHARRLA